MQRTCNDANGFLENRNLKKALFSIQFSAFSAILEMASILQTFHLATKIREGTIWFPLKSTIFFHVITLQTRVLTFFA